MELSLITFAFMSLAVVMTPGPTVLLALSNGSRFGFGCAFYGILGAGISDMVMIAATALGLGALLTTSALLFAIVRWTGVAYLIWLGVHMMRSSGKLGAIPANDARRGKPLPIFRTSLLVAVTNPKGYLFFTAFLPQFLILSEPIAPQYITLTLIVVAVDVMVMAAYAGLGARAMRFLRDRGAVWMDRTCGGILVAMGIALALLRRDQA